MRVGLLLVVVLVCAATATATVGPEAQATPASTATPMSAPTPLSVSTAVSVSGGDALDGTPAQIGDEGTPTGGTDPIEPAKTNLTIRLQPNGDAAWAIEIAIPLSGPNETRAFGDLAERYESGRAEVGPQVAPFERAVEAANEGIGREMTLLDVSRSARVENGTGYLTLEFLWTNFAAESGERMRVADAFSTPQGTWLPGLAANQSLMIVPPPGYGVNSAPIGPDNGTLRWDGPQEFEPDYLSITYRRGLRERVTTTTTTTPASGSEGGIVPLAGAAVLGAGLLVVLYARSRGVLPVLGDTDDADGDDSPAETATDADTADGSADVPSEADGSATSEELLSDEERVERLLRANGGRMRQAAIVTETQWSNAKVSQLLSAMDRENRVDKLRIGRENLISLPDADTSDVDE